MPNGELRHHQVTQGRSKSAGVAGLHQDIRERHSMKRFRHHIRESDSTCKCPDGWEIFASFETWCICIEDEEDQPDDDEDEQDIFEQVIPSKPNRPAIQFPLVEENDTVWIKVASSGMFVKIGESSFFDIPEVDQPHIWKLIEQRLHR